MIEDGDVLRITSKQEYLGEDVRNVFFYLIDVLVAGVTILEVLTEFRDKVDDFLRGIQHPAVNHIELLGENVTNLVDVDTLVLGLPGTDSTGGLTSPAFMAGGYKLNVGDKTTRPGGKRVAGIGEDRSVGENYTPDGTKDLLWTLAIPFFLSVSGTPTGSLMADPVVVGRDEFGALDLTRLSPILSVTTNPLMTSQVSRRP